MSVEVMCALCGEGVDDGDLDPCAFIVLGKWRAPETEQREQQFFAHARCLMGALHPDVQGLAEVLDIQSDMYLAED
jgi:hypothetical protein